MQLLVCLGAELGFHFLDLYKECYVRLTSVHSPKSALCGVFFFSFKKITCHLGFQGKRKTNSSVLQWGLLLQYICGTRILQSAFSQDNFYEEEWIHMDSVLMSRERYSDSRKKQRGAVRGKGSPDVMLYWGTWCSGKYWW